MSLEKTGQIRFDGYVIDRLGWTLMWREEPIALSRKSFDLLLFLVEHRDRVSSKEELLQSLWPDQFVEESNLTQHIFLLRKALSRHDSGRKIIETVPGRGYRFTAQVEIDFRPDAPQPAEPLQQQIVITASESITHVTIEEEEIQGENLSEGSLATGLPGAVRRNWSLTWVLTGALTVAAIAAAGWFGWQRWLDRTGGPPVQVVVTGIDGSTGDPSLDLALHSALRMDLSQSPFVSLVPKDAVNSTLAEMKRKPDDPLPADIAREVCERTNSQAVLHGSVARSGSHFLLTEEATSCVDGSTIAAAKEEADTVEDLPRSVDRLADSIRQKLGESRSSVARFGARLSPATTASLEALKAYSEASRLSERGELPQAIDLLKKAVVEDPGFAIAWNDLWAYTASLNGDPISSREAIQKAYSLRDSAGALERLTITAHYDMVVVGDLYKSERDYRGWTQLYPRAVAAWNGLSLTQQQLGHHADAEASAARAVALRPKYAGLNLNLALAQMANGEAQAAKATCEHAFAMGVDSDHLRAGCLSVAYQLQDTDWLKSLRDWAANHPKSPLFAIGEAEIAVGEGRFSEAQKLTAKATDIMRQQGLASQADAYTRSMGVHLIETGDMAAGAPMLRASAADPETGSDLIGLAEINDTAAASAGLQAMEKEHPEGTLWKMYWSPIIRAAIAAASNRPNEAVALLESMHPFDSKDLDLPMRRALANLAAGHPVAAEKDFRFILAHHELDPTSGFYPLAWLGLGRALSAEGNRTAAIDAYRKFLALWDHADPDALYLRQGKQEMAALQAK
jgi:DNA-binding winged helix-turn-helix (wHTH) protein/tetratricopeptide (TPR) repeat protein